MLSYIRKIISRKAAPSVAQPAAKQEECLSTSSKEDPLSKAPARSAAPAPVKEESPPAPPPVVKFRGRKKAVPEDRQPNISQGLPKIDHTKNLSDINQAEREIDQTAAEIEVLHNKLYPAYQIVVEHLKALQIRKSQLITKDHYGNSVTSAWHDEIDYFIRRNILNDRIELFDQLKEESSPLSLYYRLQYLIDNATLNADLISEKKHSIDIGWNEMDGIEFEEACCEQLQLLGWQARTTTNTGDQGVDVIADSKKGNLVVQCKRYKGSVGNKAVQEIIAGRTFERADLAAVVSTGSFTKSARQLAAASEVELLHPNELSSVFALKKAGRKRKADSKMTASELFHEILKNLHEQERSYEIEDAYELGEYAELFKKALGVLRVTKRASTSMIQRRLRIGYDQAARIMDMLEDRDIVGPENGSSPREILVDLDNYESD